MIRDTQLSERPDQDFPLPVRDTPYQNSGALAGRKGLAALIEDFLVYGQQRGYSATTLRSYREAITDFLEFFKGLDLCKIKPMDIRQWMHWLMTHQEPRP